MLTPDDHDRITALAQEFARQGRTDDLREFIEHGLSPDLLDHDGNSLLMLAAYHGQAETVDLLIGLGADVDAANQRGQTPIAGTLFKGEDAITAALLAAGADLDAGTPSARAAAAMFGREHLLALTARPAEAVVAGCFACDNTARGEALPIRERIVVTEHWRVAHAFDASLPGWLIVAPVRHVAALDDLPPAAADELGGMLHRLTAALRHEVGAVKTYVMLFAEAEGFEHLHIHLVPRMPQQPADAMGPKVFRHLGASEADRVPAEEMDRLATVLANAYR